MTIIKEDLSNQVEKLIMEGGYSEEVAIEIINLVRKYDSEKQ